MTPEMVEYIGRKEVVRGWTGLSLDERAVKLHLRFPQVKIAGCTLRLYYKKLKIKRKPVQIKKLWAGSNNRVLLHTPKNSLQTCEAIFSPTSLSFT